MALLCRNTKGCFLCPSLCSGLMWLQREVLICRWGSRLCLRMGFLRLLLFRGSRTYLLFSSCGSLLGIADDYCVFSHSVLPFSFIKSKRFRQPFFTRRVISSSLFSSPTTQRASGSKGASVFFSKKVTFSISQTYIKRKRM